MVVRIAGKKDRKKVGEIVAVTIVGCVLKYSWASLSKVCHGVWCWSDCLALWDNSMEDAV